MRRKVKALVTRVAVRKAAISATPAGRRSFPAWIDANERIVTFSAAAVTSRVRDGLVLRVVSKKKTAQPKKASDGHRAR